jgi:hypothetical protein
VTELVQAASSRDTAAGMPVSSITLTLSIVGGCSVSSRALLWSPASYTLLGYFSPLLDVTVIIDPATRHCELTGTTLRPQLTPDVSLLSPQMGVLDTRMEALDGRFSAQLRLRALLKTAREVATASGRFSSNPGT